MLLAYYTTLKNLAEFKHSNLFCARISDEEKIFHEIGTSYLYGSCNTFDLSSKTQVSNKFHNGDCHNTVSREIFVSILSCDKLK